MCGLSCCPYWPDPETVNFSELDSIFRFPVQIVPVASLVRASVLFRSSVNLTLTLMVMPWSLAVRV